MKRLLQLSTLVLVLVFSCVKEEPVMYKLTVKAQTGGSVSTSGGEYESGSTVTITATPDAEYEFTGWSNGSKDNPITITLESHQTLQASFTKKKYALNITVEGEGTVTEEIVSTGKDYDSGTKVKLTAVPAQGWELSKWSGDIDSTEESVEVTLSQAKNITVTFTKKLYDLTVNIVGEGEVNEKIITTGKTTQYEYQTTVELTAIPQEGWRFKEWEGDVTGTATQTQITVSDSKTVTATFEQSLQVETISTDFYSALKYYLDVPAPYSRDVIYGTMEHTKATFIYNYEGELYLLKSGAVPHYQYGEFGHPILFKKDENGIWKYLKTFPEVSFEEPRNFSFYNDTTFAFGETAENDCLGDPNCQIGRPGDLWMGEIEFDNIKWRRVNTDETKNYFHGHSIGDVTRDGLPDVISGNDVFIQSQEGTFTRMEYGNNADYDDMGNYILSSDPRLVKFYRNRAFGGNIAVGDLNNDGLNEIVEQNGGSDWENDIPNNLWIYSYNDETDIYERVFEEAKPCSLYTGNSGGVYTKLEDLNNDGLLDIAISKEGEVNDGEYGMIIEIWINEGNLQFKRDSFISSKERTPYVRGVLESGSHSEFRVFDVNHDGFQDIIMGGNQSVSSNIWNTGHENWLGFTMDNLIWINDGTGKFNKAKDLINGFDTTYLLNNGNGEWWQAVNLIPYMNKNGNLSFVVYGHEFTNTEGVFQVRLYDFEIKNLW